MSGIPITATSLVTIGACVLAASAVAVSLPPVIKAATTDRPEAPDFERRFEQVADKHRVQSEQDRERFVGRSLFFPASPPPGWQPLRREVERPAPPPVVAREPEDVKPAEPVKPPPVVYRGPPIVGVDGGFVYFEKRGVEDGVRVGLGETNDSLGVTIRSFAAAPASVKIEYRGEEFDLPLFEAADETLLFAGVKDIDGATGSPDSPFAASGRGNTRGREARNARETNRDAAAARGRNRARGNDDR